MYILGKDSFNKEWLKKQKFECVIETHPWANVEELKKHFLAAGGIIEPKKVLQNEPLPTTTKIAESASKASDTGNIGGVKTSNKAKPNKPTA
jgi:hypothetical protein